MTVMTPEQERMSYVLRYLLGSMESAAEDIPQLTRWEYCCAMANAISIILADVKDLPESEALRRITQELPAIMEEAYRQRRLGNAVEVAVEGMA